MPGRFALDFGTSNTVAAIWDADAADGHSLELPGLSRPGQYDGRDYHFIPSLVHYAGPRLRVGQQVLAEGLRQHPASFQWMKSYVANGMKLPRQLDGLAVDFFQAAGDFLRQVLLAAGSVVNFAEEDATFTLPVEAFEHYQNWLEEVLQSAGVARPHFLDEPSAAALGYAAKIRAGKPFLVFDFGGGTLDVAIVRVEDPTPERRTRSRALGKAGAQVGGRVLDQWLACDALKRAGRAPEQCRPLMPLLLQEAERVKEALSATEAEDFRVLDPATGAVISHRYTRGALEDLLEANGLYTKINDVLDAAENQARERGHTRDDFQACLMIGGGSLIPSIRRQLRTRYGERVHCERPFEAVAVGAAAYVAGADFDDRIRHAYALRPYDRAQGRYVFQPIVPAGTPYPGPVSDPRNPAQPLTLTIKASFPNQTRLGLQVYEVAERLSTPCGGGGLDLVFDQNGAARFTAREDPEDACHRPIGSPTFIVADPPAQPGQPRFLATFAISASRHLCITVQDTLTGKTLLRDYPMVKLT
jgi:molecular chaperone DnaK (HSP70)